MKTTTPPTQLSNLETRFEWAIYKLQDNLNYLTALSERSPAEHSKKRSLLSDILAAVSLYTHKLKEYVLQLEKEKQVLIQKTIDLQKINEAEINQLYGAIMVMGMNAEQEKNFKKQVITGCLVDSIKKNDFKPLNPSVKIENLPINEILKRLNTFRNTFYENHRKINFINDEEKYKDENIQHIGLITETILAIEHLQKSKNETL